MIGPHENFLSNSVKPKVSILGLFLPSLSYVASIIFLLFFYYRIYETTSDVGRYSHCWAYGEERLEWGTLEDSSSFGASSIEIFILNIPFLLACYSLKKRSPSFFYHRNCEEKGIYLLTIPSIVALILFVIFLRKFSIEFTNWYIFYLCLNDAEFWHHSTWLIRRSGSFFVSSWSSMFDSIA